MTEVLKERSYPILAAAVSPDLLVGGGIIGMHVTFAIAVGPPHTIVSWRVTGIRHDPCAAAHPIVVEEQKPQADRGTYLHPDVYAERASKR